MKARGAAILRAAIPLCAIATMMVGMLIGAGREMRGALVFGALPGKLADGRTVLAWQVRTALVDRGVREAVPHQYLTLRATAATSGGSELAEWRGSTNADGVAEASLAFQHVTYGDALDLEVTDNDGTVLARGRARWEGAEGRADSAAPKGPSFVRPTKEEGPLGFEVAIDGDRLVPGFPVAVWVRARAAAETTADLVHAPLVLRAEPEPGLAIKPRDPVESAASRCVEFQATPHAHVVGATFTAKGPSFEASWFGALPVAPGAFYIETSREIPAERSTSVRILAPNPRKIVYVELDDEVGRVTAGALDVHAPTENDLPEARFTLPELRPGRYRIFASGEPSVLDGAFIGRSIDVVDAESRHMRSTHITTPPPSPGAPPTRWLALDGFEAQAGALRHRRAVGIALAVGALLAGALAEIVRLAATSRKAQRAARDLAEQGGLPPPRAGATVTAGILVVLLGFALLALLLLTSR